MLSRIQLVVANLFLFIFTVNFAFGGAVSGAVFGHWTLSQSPYIVTGESYVPADRQLFIEAGVQVRFTAGASLTVYGILIANGTYQQTIEFSGYYGSTWDGLRFQNSNFTSNLLNYVIVRNANTPLVVQLSTLQVTNSSFEGLSTGLTLVRSVVQINSCNITIRGSYGIGMYSVESDVYFHNNVLDVQSSGFAQNAIGFQINSGSPNIQFNIITINATSTATGFILQNQNVGLIKRNLVKLYSQLENSGLELSDVAANVQIHHNTFRSMINGSSFNGVLIYTCRNVDLRNNIFWGRGLGIGRQILSGVVFWNYNVVYGFTENYLNGTAGPNDINSDPLLDEQTYYPTINSPVINAGDPTLPYDPDGTVADIGAFYYSFTKIETRDVFNPERFDFYCYPNPFNSSVQFRFHVSTKPVHLTIYNSIGQSVFSATYNRFNEMVSTSWTPHLKVSGIYIVELASEDFVIRRSLIYLK
ncbi:MAG: T9SS type A sorting domain-containing protein [bacterium]|nr:T9SS type A sorting domain-containing protein [bacterium]